MKFKVAKLSGIFLVIVVTSLISGCQPGHSPQSSASSTNEFQADSPQPLWVSTNEFQADFDLADGVDKMLHDLQEAIFSEKMSHGEISSEDIPARYWSAPIKALHPIKVYRDVDFGNTVVVQKIVNGIEYGKYIKPIYSPHYRGRDFTGSARNIYFMGDYQKPSSTNELRADFSQLSSSSTNEFQAMFDLMDAVQKMHDDYYDAVFSGKTPRSGDIPDRYWSELIKALHPIKVYDDLGNTVVVQKIVNGVEYGKYIGSVLSSHYPGPEFIRSRSNTNIPGMRDYQKRVIPK